jgi:uncharacterized membrane protein YidH (DUF202 family)
MMLRNKQIILSTKVLGFREGQQLKNRAKKKDNHLVHQLINKVAVTLCVFKTSAFLAVHRKNRDTNSSCY